MQFRWRWPLPFVLLLLAVPAWAHPHVWVDVRCAVVIDAGTVKGLQVTWALDSEFSQLIMADNDPAGTGKIKPSAIPGVKKGYFDNLKLYDYFTHVYEGKKAVAIPTAQKFNAVMLPSGKVQYEFFLPLNVKLEAKTPFSLSFYDDSFYVDVEFEKKTPVTFTVTGAGQAVVAFKPDKSKSYYGGGVTPTYAIVTWNP